MSSAEQKEAKIQQDSLNSIAQVSKLLRQGVANALPIAPEQYMTISIPGTVIDTTDVDVGGSYVWDPKTHHDVVPIAVQQSEARLVDGMMPLAGVMLGNTGKSVSRSYSRALDNLRPVKASENGDPNYKAAMAALSKMDKDGKTPVDHYLEKQATWAQAQDEWDTARIKAQQDAEAKYPDPKDGGLVVQAINEWNQQNFRKYKTGVQGKWMDWVVNGNKYDVENSFGIIDIESIMARVEDSKESLRNSTIVDDDGANEIQKVMLTPRNWAGLCKAKADNWTKDNGNFSLEQLDGEYDRLTQLSISYDALKGAIGTEFPVSPVPAEPAQPDAAALQKAYAELYSAEGKLNLKPGDSGLQTALDTARSNFHILQDKYQQEELAHNKWKLQKLAGDAAAAEKWIADKQAVIAKQKAGLDTIRANKFGSAALSLSAITGAHADKKGAGTDLAPPGDEYAAPVFGLAPDGSIIPDTATAANGGLDPWTKITLSYSGTDQSSSEQQSSWGMSVGGGISFGFFSVGGSYRHDESQQDVQSDMAACDVNISFEALVVNINRPWLYGELFSDFDLDVAPDYKLSPGPQILQDLIQKQTASDPKSISDLQQYNEFPAYPTSFIVAANTTIEFNGNTQHIEQHFKQQSNSGGISIGYGPFSMSGRYV